jgi:very-short-patch-repair endonuclease
MTEKVEKNDDEKKLYLIKTLSRTKRKDYENYVINAIWHKLNRPDIEVVSQQYVTRGYKKVEGKSHYFLDLYFPALKIAIECDEVFHEKQQEQDQDRTETLFDVLYAVDAADFELIRIDANQIFDKLQESIEKAVEQIKRKIEQVKPPEWKIKTAREYYVEDAEKLVISIKDKKGFKTIEEACTILFNERPPNSFKGYFTLKGFRGTPYEGYMLWFPQLAIEKKNEDGKFVKKAAARDWLNTLSKDGSEITESRENNSEPPKKDDKKRIVFVKYRDPLGRNEYKFVGIFEEFEKDITVGNEKYFKRAGEEVKLIKPEAI